MKENLSELNKLEELLIKQGAEYERNDGAWRHQINVFDQGERIWDAICQKGSFGYEEGLLEIMGVIVDGEPGQVEGWLTAKEIMRRYRSWIKKGVLE